MSQEFITIPLQSLRDWMLKKSKQERLAGDYSNAQHTLSLRQSISMQAQRQHEPIEVKHAQAGINHAQSARESMAQYVKQATDPASLQQRQIQALEAIKHRLPHGTRLHTVGQIITITLSGPELMPGVPDAPPDEDINAAIAQLQALKRAAGKARAKAQAKASKAA